ncbi:glycosyltransferase [Bradyrhizobium sp. 151]|uniref:glycosyltransferase family 2 protein n=1 Tax=Bradyrhizobium sp. 151 TaxID=2782626 RepID=UPI001FFB234C|nr:glycosyltransferase [Bradyrhizobium sp. 151]MCK1663446.1 glycosyltransferase family 2 protein [Bradyrhizobium sp. 151]
MTEITTPKLVVLMTCFNRKQSTLRSLRALPAAVDGALSFQLVLVDDGKDGTAEAVAEECPGAVLIAGSGSLFWNGGMRAAWEKALTLNPDFFLWLNDDTFLRPGAVADLLRQYREASSRRTIVVGRTVDPETGVVSYGGLVRAKRISRLNFRSLTQEERHCDTMTGNCVLIPAIAAAEVGLNSPRYRHAFGDIDYGLRARRSGYDIIELKEPVAEQRYNENWQAGINKLNSRNWRFIFSDPKGIPWREWYSFCREFGGPLWPLNFLLRYVKIASVR